MNSRPTAFRLAASIVTLSLLLLITAPAPAEPEPSDPAASLIALVELFRGIERSCEAQEWAEAEKKCLDISRAFFNIVPEPEDAATRELYFHFGSALAKFEMSIKNREMEAIETDSIPLQQTFFKIMERYDYEVPPALVFLEKDLKKSIEALDEGDLPEVEHEMMEVSAFFMRVRVGLIAKGVTEETVRRCGETIQRVETAVSEKDLAAAGDSLADLDAQVAHFISLYKLGREETGKVGQ